MGGWGRDTKIQGRFSIKPLHFERKYRGGDKKFVVLYIHDLHSKFISRMWNWITFEH